MAYRIMQGKLHKQAVNGGRWEQVSEREEIRVMALAAELGANDPEIQAIAVAERRQVVPA